MGKLILVMIFLSVSSLGFAQKNISSKGYLIFFNNRVSFFKTQCRQFDSFIKSEKDTGIEIPNSEHSVKIMRLKETSFKKRVLIRYMSNDSTIKTDSIVIGFAPVELSYRRTDSKYKPDLCTSAFLYKGSEYVMSFFCNDINVSIQRIAPLKKQKIKGK